MLLPLTSAVVSLELPAPPRLLQPDGRHRALPPENDLMSAGAGPGRSHDLILPTPRAASPRGASGPLAEAGVSPGDAWEQGIGAGEREKALLWVGVTPLAPRGWRGTKCL